MKNGTLMLAIGFIVLGTVLLLTIGSVSGATEPLTPAVTLLSFGLMFLFLGLGLALGIANRDDKLQVPNRP